MKKLKYQCCFCGFTIINSPIVLSINVGEGSSQGLYSHSSCLKSKLHPSVPIEFFKNVENDLYDIHVPLLNEGVQVWRPVQAKHIEGNVYNIISRRTDDTEEWQFQEGDYVRCKEKIFSDGQKGLVAIEKINKDKDE